MHDAFKPLQQALAAHDDWPTVGTAAAVIDAARHLIQAQEAQDQYIAYMAKLTLDPDQIRAIMSSQLIDAAGG
jgi:hypothetical protein